MHQIKSPSRPPPKKKNKSKQLKKQRGVLGLHIGRSTITQLLGAPYISTTFKLP